MQTKNATKPRTTTPPLEEWRDAKLEDAVDAREPVTTDVATVLADTPDSPELLTPCAEPGGVF